MADGPSYCIALTTAGSDAQAEALAQALIERRLAACVNVVPGVCSYFRWQGQPTREEELLLVIKTTRGATEELRLAIRELHSYQTPEFVVIGIEGGDPDYLAWLGSNVGPPG